MTPVFVCSDRYGGTYSGGAWWAVAHADALEGAGTRLDWVLRHHEGPWSHDTAVVGFWVQPPDWIAVGDTPDQACEALADNVLRERLLARGPCHKSWRGLEFERGHANDFDWYGELPRQLRYLMIATLQIRHAAARSPHSWVAFSLDWNRPQVWQRLLGDEDDILWLLVEEKDTYCAGPAPSDSIRSLVDMMIRRGIAS